MKSHKNIMLKAKYPFAAMTRRESFSRRWIVFFVAERVPLKGQQHLICIGPK
jgi:hypothetical protein